jgi:hypothetical protein
MQNLVCLKWSAYYRVAVSWNLLLGFPGETNDDYLRQIDLIPSLLHLQPPESAGRFWLERFSPYFTRPRDYGLRITGPGMAYEYVYDTRQVDVKKIAYDFEYELDQWLVDPHVFQDLIKAVEHWKQMYQLSDRPFLFYSKAPRYVTVYDGRNPLAPTRQRYDGLAASVIEICNEAAKGVEQIYAAVAERMDGSESALVSILNDLASKRILYEERGKYFTLALPENQYL